MAKRNPLAEGWIQETFDLCAHVYRRTASHAELRKSNSKAKILPLFWFGLCCQFQHSYDSSMSAKFTNL